MLEPTGYGMCFRCAAGKQRAVPVWRYEGYDYCETCKVLNGTDCEQQAVRDAFRSGHLPAREQPKNLPLCGGKCGGNDPPKPPEMVAGQRTATPTELGGQVTQAELQTVIADNSAARMSRINEARKQMGNYLARRDEAVAGLPTDSAERKACPVFSGVLAYFPDAIAEVARLSKVGNDKHNPGQALHWTKEKSTDHDDCIVRHMMNVAKGELIDPSYPGKNIRHRAAVAWRALAALQIEIENETKGTK